MASYQAKVMITVAFVLFTLSNAASIRSLGSSAMLQDGKLDNREDMGINPIRKVVSLLQKMADKVEKEAEEEKELFEKFDCYCKTEGGNLELSISSSTAKVPSIQSDIEEATATVAQLKQDLINHAAARTSAKEAIADATAMREKENAAYVSESTELKGYVSALDKAIAAISSGMSGTKLLQAGVTLTTVRRAVMASTESEDDQQAVLSFLSGQSLDETSYVPASGEVVGILKTMLESFSKNLAEVEEKEATALSTFEDLIASKQKEIASLSDSIEKKTARSGDLQMEIVRMQAELSDTEAALIEDQKFLKSLDGDCESKKSEYEERLKVRANELVAIHETIKILNDDDALELFKKTLPSASLLQINSGGQLTQQKMQAFVSRIAEKLSGYSDKLGGHLDIRFLELALMGRKVDFSKIIKMIDNMVAILKQEQADDDSKQEYCEKQLDITEDKVKEHQKTVSDLEASIDEHTTTIAALADEVKVLQGGITALDKSVQEATEQRKKENEEYTELMSSDSAAKELLEFAKNRLNKFYNPKLYSTPKPEPEPTEFLQLGAQNRKDAPPPPPATWGAYQKQGDNAGVISMINLLIRDLDKEMTTAETQEKDSQKDYEDLMNDSAAKRAKDLKLIGVKESTKADLEQLLISAQGDLDATKKELSATVMYEGQLHSECDWLMQNYDIRKTARADESDNLKAAKAILSGADFSLLQGSSQFLSRTRKH